MKTISVFQAAVVLVLFCFYAPAVAQTQHVSSEEIMQTAFELKKATQALDDMNEDAIRYCGATKTKYTTLDLEKSISENLAQSNSQLPRTIPASHVWKVAKLADLLQTGLALDMMLCSVNFSDDPRARSTSLRGTKVYSDFNKAKTHFETLALEQTMWQEEQQAAMKEQ